MDFNKYSYDSAILMNDYNIRTSNKNAQKIVVIMVIVSKGNAFVDLVGVEIVVLRSARRIVFEMY